MSNLPGRDRSALVIIDVQNAVVDGAHDRDGVVARIAGLLDRARAAAVPVVWVQHQDEQLVRGTERWEYVPELVRRDDEPLIEKSYGDAFEETELEATLASLNVGSLIVAGAQTDACIRCTLHGAITRGYDALLVSDAHTTEDSTAYGAPPPELVIAHTNLYWQYHEAPGRTAGTAATSDVSF